MSTPVNSNRVDRNAMRKATIKISLERGLNYNSFPYDSSSCDEEEAETPSPQPEEEIVIPPLQVFDSPPPNQIMGDPENPPSNPRPPMREHLANGGYVPQRLVFPRTVLTPLRDPSERTITHRSLEGTYDSNGY